MRAADNMFELLIDPELEHDLMTLAQFYQLRGVAVSSRSGTCRLALMAATPPKPGRAIHLRALREGGVRRQLALGQERARLNWLCAELRGLVEEELRRSGRRGKAMRAALRGERLTEAATLRYYIAQAATQARRYLLREGLQEVHPIMRAPLPPRITLKTGPVVVKLRRDQKQALLAEAQRDARTRGEQLNLSTFVVGALLAQRGGTVPYVPGDDAREHLGLYFSGEERAAVAQLYGKKRGSLKRAVLNLLGPADLRLKYIAVVGKGCLLSLNIKKEL